MKPKLSEADVQRAVVDFLALDGWRAIRTDPVSDKSRGKGFGEVGMPDYLFIRYRRPQKETYLHVSMRVECEVFWVEFKRLGRRPDSHQDAWHATECSRGALVMIVDNPDAFFMWYAASGLERRVRT